METAQIRVGAHVHYRPLFRRFPHDVPDDMEYLIRRVTAAWINHLEPERANRQERVLACGHFINASMFDLDTFGACPICQRQDADLEIGFDDIAHAVEGRKTRVIGAVLPSELATFARVRLTNATALHPEEREIVTMLYSDPQWQATLPERIGFKENVAIVADALLEAKTPQEVQEALAHEVRSATDVLRIAAAIRESDPSLSTKQPIRLPHRARRMVLEMLEQQREPLRDMMRHRSWFLHLGKHLHAGAYGRRYPRTAAAFGILRNAARTVEKPGAPIERAMRAARKAPDGALALASELRAPGRGPGEFARRLDFMLRYAGDNAQAILDAFKEVVDGLETPMLLKVAALFRARAEPAPDRTANRLVAPKGNVAKMHVLPDTRKLIDPGWCLAVETQCRDALRRRFAKRPPLGEVWVDPRLRNIILPLDMRTGAKGAPTVGRGSRIAVDRTGVVRLFLWWKETPESGRVDVDLSSTAYDAEWKEKGEVDYITLRTAWGLHSGDIQSGSEGAAEFIEIDVANAIAHNVRYVQMVVISFTGQPFSSFTAHAGAMTRTQPNGKRLDPTTVETKFAIQAEAVSYIPAVFDLATHELVWTDLTMGGGARMRVGTRNDVLGASAEAVVLYGAQRPSVHDLVTLNVEARGSVASSATQGASTRRVTLEEVLADVAGTTGEWLDFEAAQDTGANASAGQ